MKKLLFSLLLSVPCLVSAENIKMPTEDLEHYECESSGEVMDTLHEIMNLVFEDGVCEKDQIYVHLPNCSEPYHVASPEECLKRTSSSLDPLGMLITALSNKKSNPNSEMIKKAPCPKNPNHLLSTPLTKPSDAELVTGSLEMFSKDQLLSMIKNQMEIYNLKVNPYDHPSWSTRQIMDYHVVCFNQANGFLAMARAEAATIYEAHIRTAAQNSIEEGIAGLVITRSPKQAVVIAIVSALTKICVRANGNVSEMYKYLETARVWAEAADMCSDAIAKRLSY